MWTSSDIANLGTELDGFHVVTTDDLAAEHYDATYGVDDYVDDLSADGARWPDARWDR